MKRHSFRFLIIGFLAGIVYVSACGGGTSTIAATIGDAVDVLFDNVSSGLQATNVQAAIDEVDGRIDALETGNFSTLLVGTWTGSEMDENVTWSTEGTLTLNSNGTYSCYNFLSRFTAAVCAAPVSWETKNKILKLTYTVPEGFNASGNIFLPVHHVDSANLALLDGSDDIGMTVIQLSK